MKQFLSFGLYNHGKTVWNNWNDLDKEQQDWLDAGDSRHNAEDDNPPPDLFAIGLWTGEDDFAHCIAEVPPELRGKMEDGFKLAYDVKTGNSISTEKVAEWYAIEQGHDDVKPEDLLYFQRLKALMGVNGCISVHGDLWRIDGELWKLTKAKLL